MEKFRVTSVIKIYPKMWKLRYNHYNIPLSSKCKFKIQTNVFPGNNNAFTIKSTVVWVSISKKNTNFFTLKPLYNRLANKIKFILPLEKSFRTLKDVTIGTEDT